MEKASILYPVMFTPMLLARFSWDSTALNVSPMRQRSNRRRTARLITVIANARK